MTFYGDEKAKNYQACWKKIWLFLLLACLLYCPCLYCLCCYLLYRKANRVIKGPDVGGGVEIQKNGGQRGGQSQGPDLDFSGQGRNQNPNFNVPQYGNGRGGNMGPGNGGGYNMPQYGGGGGGRQNFNPQANMNRNMNMNPPQYGNQYQPQQQNYNQNPGMGMPQQQWMPQYPQQGQQNGYGQGRIIGRRVISTTRKPPQQLQQPQPNYQQPYLQQQPNYQQQQPPQQQNFSQAPTRRSSMRGKIKIIEKEPTLIIERPPNKERVPTMSNVSFQTVPRQY